jgi:putative transcriptional regulator
MSNLAVYRKKAGYSQKALAQASGLSQPMIWLLERGSSQTSLDNARAIVAAINEVGVICSMDDVFPPKEKIEAA